MIKVKKTTVRRGKRIDDMLYLTQSFTGELDTPASYNSAYANILRLMADKIEGVKNAYVDPELVVWFFAYKGRIEAQVTLSPKE
jgi:hypothetical protein